MVGRLLQRAFGQKTNLDRHIKTVHENDREYSCSVCPRKCISMANLRKHEMIHRSDAPKYGCSVCKKEFTCKFYLAKHEKIAHGDVEEAICPICQKSLKSKFHLQVHVRQKHVSEPQVFNCQTCDSTFTAKASLKRHTKLLHEK